MDICQFKSAMSQFVTSVSVINTVYKSVFYSFTSNSVSSVSLSPVLVSFCLSNDSGSFIAFNQSEHFIINLLSENQTFVAQHCAQKGHDKLSVVDHTISSVTGVAIIKNCVLSIECKKYNMFLCGDHTIFIGRVINIYQETLQKPLSYYDRKYLKI